MSKIVKGWELVAGNPLSASVVGTFQVLTNPFREERTSFKRRYNHVRAEFSDMDLWEEVDQCPNCAHSVNERMFHEGDTNWNWDHASRSYPLRTFNSHCSVHWKRVRKYQDHRDNARKSTSASI